jgi:hypothetical protein
MNVEWVPKNIVLRKLKNSESARMAANCLLKYGISFQYNPDTRMPKQLNVMKLKCADQRFRLGYKPKKDDYKCITRIKRGARMAKIESQEPKEKELIILPLRTTFSRPTQVIRFKNEMLKIIDLHIRALECKDEEHIEEVKVKVEDEMLP